MRQSGNIIIFLLACIAFIGIAAALKSASVTTRPELAKPTVTVQQIRSQPEPLVPDKAFLAQPITSAITPEKIEQAEKKAVVSDFIVTARSYLVGDIATGHVYAERNSRTIVPFASMSKLMTAIVAADTYTATSTVVITPSETEVPADASALKAGERFSAKELAYPMLMNSSNVAAEALSSTTNRTRFLELMSSYAWEIGMKDTYFADPTGLSARNAGTARDFFALARYLYSNRPGILAITRLATSSVATTTEHGRHLFTNIHPFVTDRRFLGGKTGHTPEALDTMLTIMNVNGKPTAFIVLHSEDRQRDTQILIEQVSALMSIGG